jgi:hypothetical protein
MRPEGMQCGVCDVPEQAKNSCENTVALEAVNELFEGFLDSLGNKEARGVLRAVAARVARPAPSSTVVPIRGQPVDLAAPLAARAWLQERLPGWMARHG